MSTRTISRLNRILALIPFLIEREVVPVAEVLERFGYTMEELTRDINTVITCGLPGYGPADLMWVHIDGDEVVMDAADYFSRAPRLTPTEALGLLVSGMTAVSMGLDEDTPALRTAVNKLSKALIPGADSALSVDLLDDTENVAVLREAVAGSNLVRISYRSVGKEETTERDIEPWSIFHTIGRWYVIGHCRLVDGERTFRVDRIRNLEVLDDTFDPPGEIPEQGVGYSPSEGDVSCVIDLGPGADWVLSYYPVEIVKELKSKTRVRFWSPDAEVPARLLLRLGSNATLVDGDEVATRLRALGDSLLAKHS